MINILFYVCLILLSLFFFSFLIVIFSGVTTLRGLRKDIERNKKEREESFRQYHKGLKRGLKGD